MAIDWSQTARGVLGSYVNQIWDKTKSAASDPVGTAGDYYSTLFDVMGAPGKGMQTAVAGSPDTFQRDAEIAGSSILGINPVLVPPLMNAQNIERQMSGGTSTRVADALQALPQSPIHGMLGSLLATSAVDPTSYVGGGLTKPGTTVHFLEGLTQVGINKALLAPALIPKTLAEIPLPGAGLGRLFTRTVENPTTGAITRNLPTRSVGDYLWGGPSRGGLLDKYARDVYDAVEHLMARGHDLGADVNDFTNALNGRAVPVASNFAQAQGMSQAGRNRVGGLLQAAQATHPLEAQNIDRALTVALQQSENARGLRMAQELIGVTNPADILAIQELHGLALHNERLRFFQAAEDVLGQHTRMPANLSTPEGTLSSLMGRADALEYLTAGRPGIVADLPVQLQQRGDLAFRTMADAHKSLLADREHIEKALENVWQIHDANTGGRLGPYQPMSGLADPAHAMQEINSRLAALGIAPITPTRQQTFTGQFLDRMRGRAQSNVYLDLEKAAKSWSGAGDMLTENPYRLVFDRAVRQRATELGLTDSGPLSAITRPLNTLMTLWKSATLMSPNYLIQNALGGLVNSALGHVDPMLVARNYARNLGTAIRGGEVSIPEIAAQNARLGLATPSAASSSAGFIADSNDLRSLSGKGQDVMERVGWLPMALAGSLIGGTAGYESARDDQLPPWARIMGGALIGAGAMGAMPAFSKHVFQPLARGTEDVLRQSAIVTGRDHFLAEAGDDVARIVDQALGSPMVAIPGGVPGPVQPQSRQQVIAYLDSLGNQTSREGFEKLLQQAGVQPDAIRGAGDLWSDLLRSADDHGAHLSDAINFNYKDLTNIEEFTRQILPFSTWGTKALPFFAARIAEHPLIGVALSNYQDLSERQRDEGGLTGRFAGSVHVPALDHIWGALVANPGKVFYNPLRGIAPMADASRTLAFDDPNATPYQSLIRTLEAVGPTMHPAIDFAARISGLSGTDAPKGLIRQGNPIKAITGIDLNQPFAELERGIRTNVLGQATPANPAEQSTLKRIDELALRETGHPIGDNSPELAPYLDAKARKTGDIWKRASAEVARESGVRSAGGFLWQGMTPSATLTPEEEQIRGARKWQTLPPEMSQQIQAMVRQNPKGSQTPDVQQALRAGVEDLVARNRPGEEIPADVQRLLDNPTWENGLKLRNQMLEAQGQTDPLIRGYSGSGSPDQQHIQHLISAYRDIPTMLLKDRKYAHMMPEDFQAIQAYLDAGKGMSPDIVRASRRATPLITQLQKDVQAHQEAFLRENPMLQGYLDFKKDNPDAGVEDFITATHR